MDSWFKYLRHGLSRKLPEDQLKEQSFQPGIRVRLGNLRPYLKHHWCMGVLGFTRSPQLTPDLSTAPAYPLPGG
jgi:hypothetical protein